MISHAGATQYQCQGSNKQYIQGHHPNQTMELWDWNDYGALKGSGQVHRYTGQSPNKCTRTKLYIKGIEFK